MTFRKVAVFVGFPIQEVVWGAVEDAADGFYVVQPEYVCEIIQDFGGGLRRNAGFDEGSVGLFDAAEFEKRTKVEV